MSNVLLYFQVQELFECNVRLFGLEGDAEQSLVNEQSSKEATKESSQSDAQQDTVNSTSSDSTDRQTATSESTNCDSAGATDNTPVELSDVKFESKDTDSNETESNTKLCKDDTESTTAQAGTDCNKNKANSARTEAGASGGEDDKKVTKKTRKSSTGEGARPKETAGLVAGNRKAKDLCHSTCRLLKEQIMKVHDDLDRQWQVLREAGVIL